MNARAKQVEKILMGFQIGDRVIVKEALGCPQINGPGRVVLPRGGPHKSLCVRIDSRPREEWWCDPVMVEFE